MLEGHSLHLSQVDFLRLRYIKLFGRDRQRSERKEIKAWVRYWLGLASACLPERTSVFMHFRVLLMKDVAILVQIVLLVMFWYFI